MAYVLTLLAVLAASIFFTPARDTIGQSIIQGSRAAMNAVSSQDLGLGDLFDDLKSAVREKSMKLLREQLHDVIDDSVQ